MIEELFEDTFFEDESEDYSMDEVDVDATGGISLEIIDGGGSISINDDYEPLY